MSAAWERDVDKAPDAFRTISEVAEDLDIPQHVLRFWETRFPQIKPLKRGGGRRYYRPDDVALIKGIRHLLYGEGYTIKGVQRILKEEGLRHVQTIWMDVSSSQDGAAPPQPGAEHRTVAPVERATVAPPSATAFAVAEESVIEPVPSSPAAPPAAASSLSAAHGSETAVPPLSSATGYPVRADAPMQAPVPEGAPVPLRPAGVLPREAASRPLPFRPVLVEESATRPGFVEEGPRRNLALSEIRDLQAALFELGECRRVLALAMASDPADV